MPLFIEPEASPLGLFRVARMIPASSGSEYGLSWENGQWDVMSLCPASRLWPKECPSTDGGVTTTNAIWTQMVEDAGDTYPTKCDGPEMVTEHFKPFDLYEALSCMRGRLSNGIVDAGLTAHMEVNREALITQALEYGYGGVGLAQAATFIDGTPAGTATPIQGAIQHLLRTWKEGRSPAAIPTFHIPLEAAIDLATLNLIEPSSAGPATFAGGTARLSLGAYGVPDGAAQATLAADAPGTPLPPGEAWVYVTGEIQISTLTEAAQIQPNTSVERFTNTHQPIVEQMAAYRFDPCNVYVMKVSF